MKNKWVFKKKRWKIQTDLSHLFICRFIEVWNIGAQQLLC